MNTLTRYTYNMNDVTLFVLFFFSLHNFFVGYSHLWSHQHRQLFDKLANSQNRLRESDACYDTVIVNNNLYSSVDNERAVLKRKNVLLVKEHMLVLKYSKLALHCQFFHDVKEKSQLELCALLAIAFRTAKQCTRWSRIFEGLSQDVGLADFALQSLRLSF